MSALDHLKRYPNARPSTISYLAERDRINEQLRREIAAKKRRDMFLYRVGRRLWPSWVWR